MRNGSKYCGDLGRASTEGWPGPRGAQLDQRDDVAIWHGAVLRTGALACFPGEGGLASENPESHGRGPAHR